MRIITLLLPMLVLLGCNTEMKMIDKPTLQAKLEASLNNSAESWWYAGDKDGMQVIVVKMPFSKEYYLLNQEDVRLPLRAFSYTGNEAQWVNLKAEHFKFQ